MDAHPAAALFPMLSDTELAVMGRDIAEHGQQHPVIVWRGVILDGRNRTRACELVGRKPDIKDVSDLSERDAIQLVISSNIHRRHLTDEQRDQIGSRLVTMQAHRPSEKDPQNAGVNIAAAAEMVHSTPARIERARTIERADPKLADQVISGEITKGQALKKIKELKRRKTNATDPDLADDSIVDATDERTAEGDTPKSRAVLAAVSRLDPTELTFIKPDLLKMLGV